MASKLDLYIWWLALDYLTIKKKIKYVETN